MTVAFYTLGCKLNQSETESIAASFKHSGFGVVSFTEAADLYVINTCTVTSKSDQKARRMIRLINSRQPMSMVIITGCYAEVEQEKLESDFEAVHFMAVIPQSRKSVLMDIPEIIAAHTGFAGLNREKKYSVLQNAVKQAEKKHTDLFSLNNADFLFHSRAFVKIQDGCDGMCAYCRVPLARGKAQSLDSQKVIERVLHLEEQGFREIVLTGVNISAYQCRDIDFETLLDRLINSTKNIRYRISSLEPEKISASLAGILAHPLVCPHFHIPVQSGSEEILKKMRRRYSAEKLRNGVLLLKNIKPEAFFAADVIVGFPGESDEDFNATKQLVMELGFSKLHVFPFSARPGTQAVSLKGHIPEGIVKNRVQELIEYSHLKKDEYIAQLKGKNVDIVLEKEAGVKSWIGTAGESIRCKVEHIPKTAGKKKNLIEARVFGAKEPCRTEYLQDK